MNRSTFECRSTGNFEESILVLEALFPIAFRDVQRNRLRSAKPLIARLPVDALERSRDLKGEGNVIDRQAIDVQSLMVESRFWYQRSFEYEYEYRCTEYEYESAGRTM
jgi:hypothetical protein